MGKICILGDIPFLKEWLKDYETTSEKEADVVFVDLWYNNPVNHPNLIYVSG